MALTSPPVTALRHGLAAALPHLRVARHRFDALVSSLASSRDLVSAPCLLPLPLLVCKLQYTNNLYYN
ncbi:hypothetical protein GUJ93_ZPchr0006g42078 [Zizania palustris]|uniref:Uncharacterized protein n=1 Tax=Zizania palustris TaxID=103762 RepID=A0A8J5T241_ZIZPA|nr:hypothetical protein GUJ93_ZPchr0006g42078 [Zizania palustris]